jgi:hypothetical protein
VRISFLLWSTLLGLAELIGSPGWLDCMSRCSASVHPPCLIGCPPGVAGIPRALGLTLVDSVVTSLLHTMYDSRVGLRGTMVSEAGGSRLSQAKSCRWSYWLFVDTSTSAWGTAAGRECVRCGTRLLQLVGGWWWFRVVGWWCREGAARSVASLSPWCPTIHLSQCGPWYWWDDGVGFSVVHG